MNTFGQRLPRVEPLFNATAACSLVLWARALVYSLRSFSKLPRDAVFTPRVTVNGRKRGSGDGRV